LGIVSDAAGDRSEAWVMNAKDVASGPVCRVALPQRVPIGFHACWIPG
jgi:carotenoid cleavage dioxygenase